MAPVFPTQELPDVQKDPTEAQAHAQAHELWRIDTNNKIVGIGEHIYRDSQNNKLNVPYVVYELSDEVAKNIPIYEICPHYDEKTMGLAGFAVRNESGAVSKGYVVIEKADMQRGKVIPLKGEPKILFNIGTVSTKNAYFMNRDRYSDPADGYYYYVKDLFAFINWHNGYLSEVAFLPPASYENNPPLSFEAEPGGLERIWFCTPNEEAATHVNFSKANFDKMAHIPQLPVILNDTIVPNSDTDMEKRNRFVRELSLYIFKQVMTEKNHSEEKKSKEAS